MFKIQYLYIIILFLSINSNAQIGINTDTPNSNVTLDVDGKTNVQRHIYLGDNNLNHSGNAGTSKDLIISGGPDAAPYWENKKLPPGYGLSFTMTHLDTFFDEDGLSLSGGNTNAYTKNETLSSAWTVIPGLNNTFPIYKNDSKVNLNFQTIPQINRTDSNSGSASFACGIFMNSQSQPNVFTLKAVRVDAVRGTAGSNKIFNMNVTLDGSDSTNGLIGSPAGNQYEIRVACRPRTISSGTSFSIGRAINTDFLTSEMARSSLSIFVLENW